MGWFKNLFLKKKANYCAVAFMTAISLVFLYCLFIGIGTVCFSADAELGLVGILLAVVSGVILFVNVLLILKLISCIRFKKKI